MSSEFVIHLRNFKDYRFISFDAWEEIIKTIIDILFNVWNLCTVFPIYEVPIISL